MPPLTFIVLVYPTLLDLLKYCKKHANWTQNMQLGEARGGQEKPVEARRSKEIPEGPQDDSNLRLEFEHQNTLEKAWGNPPCLLVPSLRENEPSNTLLKAAGKKVKQAASTSTLK